MKIAVWHKADFRITRKPFRGGTLFTFVGPPAEGEPIVKTDHGSVDKFIREPFEDGNSGFI